MSASELAASPSVLISENYWQQRFAGDPAALGKSIRLSGALFTIVGITPANFTGTSVAVPNFWLPLSLYPLVHHDTNRLRDREDLCCRVFGRLSPGVSMREAQSEATVLASRLRALHEPYSELRKQASAVISPGSPLPGINASLSLTIVLIMAAAGWCWSSPAPTPPVCSWRGSRPSAGTRHAALARRQPIASDSPVDDRKRAAGRAGGFAALPVTWAMMRLAVTKLAEQCPSSTSFSM